MTWTAERIDKALSDCGVTATKRGALEYLARLINESTEPTANIPYQQDNVVIWKPGFKP